MKYNNYSVLGFNRITPLAIDFNYDPIIEQLKEHIREEIPYLFITITMRRGIPDLKRVKYVNGLLHQYNQLVFGGNYKKKGKGLRGYAVFEDHRSEALKGLPHAHLLVTNQKRLERYSFSQLEGMFWRAANEVRDGGKQVFNPNCLDIQPVKSDRVIGYCLKDISERNLHRLKTFGTGGLSDNLYHVNP